MPASSKLAELSWQLEMLRLLPKDEDGLSYEEIRKELAKRGFGLTKRTIERAINGLAPLGLLSHKLEGRKHWYWPLHYRSLDLQGMSVAEAVSMRLVEQMVAPLLPEQLRHELKARFDLGNRKLNSVKGKNVNANWPDKIAAVQSHLTLLPPKLDSEILATVQHALLENRELLVDYRRLKDDMLVARRLHPRALLQSGSVTYLIATQPDTDKDPDKPIQYRLDRIQKAVTSGRGVSRSSFNLEQYLAAQEHRVGDLEWLDLELWVSEDLAKILRETALSDDQELIEISRRDGSILRARVRNTLRLEQWLLGHREHLEVKKPVKLRNWMRKTLQAALARYE
jgi:predicted DNA-binding transcriptional regulator YafY